MKQNHKNSDSIDLTNFESRKRTYKGCVNRARVHFLDTNAYEEFIPKWKQISTQSSENVLFRWRHEGFQVVFYIID